MRKLFPFLIAPVLASCSNDIVVKSDLGETSIIKKSAVTVQKIDPLSVEKKIRERLKLWEISFSVDECNSRNFAITRESCFETRREHIEPLESDLSALPDVPPMKIVKYRTIYTNVNGDKSATNYDHVACIPEGTSEERKIWSRLATEYGPKGTEDNLAADGSVASGVRREVCKKYG